MFSVDTVLSWDIWVSSSSSSSSRREKEQLQSVWCAMTSNQSTSNTRGPQYWLWYLWYHDWWYILSLADQQPAPPSQSNVPIYLAKILNIFLEVWKHHFNSMKYWELMSILKNSTLHWIWIVWLVWDLETINNRVISTPADAILTNCPLVGSPAVWEAEWGQHRQPVRGSSW